MNEYPLLQSDYLSVGDNHEIYFEVYGNPDGKPILFIHGGPGAGFSEHSKQYFDPQLWKIILFDQRGAGRSKPFASTENNTTDDLVEDINKLLKHLNIEKITLFGGSWGATLATVYAIRNKEKVNGMILRGIYLPSTLDHEYMFLGGIRLFRPQEWERFVSQVPPEHQKDPAPYYWQQMKSGNETERNHFAYEWAYYEMSIMHLRPNKKAMEEDMKDMTYKSLSPLEAHYLLQNCFLPEHYILENVHALSGIPTTIINGKYDFVCPPLYAYTVHQQIKGSKLYWTIAGHASGDPANKRKLILETKKMYKQV